jgi:hypothetical protein
LADVQGANARGLAGKLDEGSIDHRQVTALQAPFQQFDKRASFWRKRTTGARSSAASIV